MRAITLIVLIILLAACTPNNVDTDNSFKKYFEENKAQGCFALLNNGTGRFTVYNLSRYRDSSYLPASTFKIVNSLIGLQTGDIVNDSMIIRWDGIDRGRPECNLDLSMYSAFRASCPAWYMELARRVGKDTMQSWLDTLGYGNKTISRFDTFWLDNSLKIKPDEQLGLAKKLYFNLLPFHKTNQEIVKKAMVFENNTNYQLSYKTGWGRKENGAHLGWVLGWIEENRHPYFFVLNLESNDPAFDMTKARMDILKGILEQMGFFQGKM